MPSNLQAPPCLAICLTLGISMITCQVSRGERIDFPKEWSESLPEQFALSPSPDVMHSAFPANVDASDFGMQKDVISLPPFLHDEDAASADTRIPAFAAPSGFATSRSNDLLSGRSLLFPSLVVAMLIAVTLHFAAAGVSRRAKRERTFQRATPVVRLGVNVQTTEKMVSAPSFLRRFGGDERSSEAELLAAYRLQSLHLHPDVGGSINEFKLMQRDFERAVNHLRLREGTSSDGVAG